MRVSMRSAVLTAPIFVVSIFVVSMCPAVRAQCVDPIPPKPSHVQKVLGDGSPDSWWKVNNPSGPSDWFNVDFDSLAASCTVLGISLDLWDVEGGADVSGVVGSGTVVNGLADPSTLVTIPGGVSSGNCHES